MARGFLPVDTSGISQGISDAASGLGGWLSNAFTRSGSAPLSEGYYPRTGTPIGTSLLSGEVGNVKEMFFPPDFDTTRTYGWNDPDLNDIIANTYRTRNFVKEGGIPEKLRRDLSNDAAHIQY